MTTNKKSLSLPMDVILDSIADGVFTIDADKNVTYFNKAAEKHGVTPGGGHCGLNKTRLGAHALGIIPKGDLSMARGIVWFNHALCKGIGADSLMSKKTLKKDLKVPIIVVEGDIYDARFYNRQQMRTRVESFAEMLKTYKKIA